jgi:hypothetical protein
MALSDWTYEKTISPSKTIVIKYALEENGQFVDKTARLKSTAYSLSISDYSKVTYAARDVHERDELGAISRRTEYETEEVLTRKITITRDTVASVNGALVKWCLENQQGLPEGSIFKLSFTYYDYTVQNYKGVKPLSEETREYIDEIELIGSLNINDYAAINAGELAAGIPILATETKIEYTEFDGDVNIYNQGTRDQFATWRQYNKTKTERWVAAGLTQEGQQAAADMLKQEDGSGDITWSVILEFAPELSYEGVEVRSSIGKLQYSSKPSDQDLAQEEIRQPDDEDFGTDEVGPGSVSVSGADTYIPDVAQIFDLDEDSINWPDYAGDSNGDGIPDWADWVPEDTDWQDFTGDSNGDGIPDWADVVPDGGGSAPPSAVTYDMPFAPDDYLDNSGRVVKGNAAQAAAKYGATLNSMRAASSYGFNITTALDRVGTDHLAPVYVSAGGVRVAGRMNGTSWAMGNMGIVVSADVMLSGAVSRSAG